ncbi:lipase esterase [Colletotrichum truncatum]|uniref:Lipase esterase n=1 Tax=Colletotrichum truncatum TaxID=5467 RepID=A0ACC3YQM7_COLTU|nr:lipase esterase [Colletotrichum truncatum]KAF6798942.1 lipase esterase [Colletotrichum truncatum]
MSSLTAGNTSSSTPFGLHNPLNMDPQQFKLLLSLLPKVPLITRVALLHVLQLSKPAKYLDLRSELIVAVLRSYLQSTKPRSITSSQKLANRDNGVKGRMWVATYASPVPPEADVRDALVEAIQSLRAPDTPEIDLRLPDVVSVEAEWTGYRADATPESKPPAIGEKEKFDELQEEVTSPLTVLYFHGGAYYLCDPATHRPATKKIAKLTGGRIYSVRYRLAPQNPFPAALLDALISYLTLLYPPPDAYHQPVEPKHIVVAGDSAGGNLSLALLQLLLELRRQDRKVRWLGRERDIPLPGGFALNSPWLDITQSSPSWESNWEFDYLPKASLYADFSPPPCDAWPAKPPRTSIYVDDDLIAHPLVTLVMNRSWTGSPPIFICTGWELLADEDRYMARKLREDGVPVVFEEYEGMPHCFALILSKIPSAKRCFEGWTGFMKTIISDPEKITSKAVTVKAKTQEDVPREFASLSTLTDEDIQRLVLQKKETSLNSAPEAVSKL